MKKLVLALVAGALLASCASSKPVAVVNTTATTTMKHVVEHDPRTRLDEPGPSHIR